MNSMEYYNKNNRPEGRRSPENKTNQTPLTSKIRNGLLVAFLGIGLTIGATKVAENRAEAAIIGAGIPPEVAHDPDLIWAAMNGASASELNTLAGNIMRNNSLMLNNTMEEMSEFSPDDTLENSAEIAPEFETFALEKLTEGVYGFTADKNIEVTSQNFIKQLRESLGQAGQVFFAVPDDNYGTTRVFTDSTINGYRDNYGNFYAYIGDYVYVATDAQALNNLLSAKGINHETFGLP